jgi:drug/metabolite transporter (DMT)-like permease
VTFLKHPLFGSAVAVTGAFAYGFNIPAARVASLGGVTGSNLGFQRGIVLVAVLLIFFIITGRSFRMQQGEAGKITLAGLCAGLTAVGLLSSLSFIPVSIAVAIFYMFPLILILLTPMMGGEKLSSQKLITFVIAFAGILLCIGPTFEQMDWRGIALATLAAFSCAFLIQIASTIKQDRVSLIFWLQLFCLPLLLPVAWATGLPSLPVIENVWLAIAISSIGFYIGFVCQVFVADKVHPATLGLIFLIEPVIALLVAALFLGERMLPLQYLGIALVFAGIAYDLTRDILRQRENAVQSA